MRYGMTFTFSLNIVDDFSREAIAMEITLHLVATHVAQASDRIAARSTLRLDRGLAFVALASTE